MKRLVSVFQFIFFSNIYVSLCALSFTVKTALLLYGNCGSLKVNMLVFFATLFLYGFHRIYNRSKMLPEERGEARHHWADRYQFIFRLLTVVSFIVATILMCYMPLRVWLLLIPMGLLGLGYSLPVIPTNKGWKKLRELSWLKSIWIAIAYGWITTVIPVAYQTSVHGLFEPAVLFVFIRSVLFVFILVIPFDIRDMLHDSQNGLKTIPVLLGAERSIRLAIWLLMVFSLFVVIQFRYYHLSTAATVALIISAIEVAIVVPLSKKSRPDIFYPVAIETSMIFHFLVIFLAIRFS
jgi:4-hydroxybenzoate polyprenyltransferase